MTVSLLRTLLDLGNATSENLNFSYENDAISFNEETITETNLLEIRRRHPSQVRIRTFSKAQESAKTGADWEWHIVGVRHTLKMRVQAKRVNKLGIIKDLARRANGSSLPQIDMLIQDAAEHNMKPAYCFYSSEIHRTFWNKNSTEYGRNPFEFGCLISDAKNVKIRMPKRMEEIEKCTVPWHYLWSRHLYEISSAPHITSLVENDEYRTIDQIWTATPMPEVRDASLRFPTVVELNEGLVDGTDPTGIFATGEVDSGEVVEPRVYRDRRIALLLVIDVRIADPMLRHFESLSRQSG